MNPTPLSEQAITQHFGAYVNLLKQRLDIGRQEYGDQSFLNPPENTIRELQQECLDLAGWGFILYVQLCRLEDKLNAQ